MSIDRNDAIGAAQVAGGSYIAYQGLKHGLPRTFGIRMENHTTSKANADLIKKTGNYLDPSFGGKGGWSEKIRNADYVQNSKGYVHITGAHPDGAFDKMIKEKLAKKNLPKFLNNVTATLCRKLNNLMYRTVGNTGVEELKAVAEGSTGKSKSEIYKWFGEQMKKNIFANKTKKFYIPGTDSYFTKNFTPDPDSCMALKSTKPIKVYTNRFSAMMAGLKEFGLKGMKENKGRVAAGLGLIYLTGSLGGKLVKKGVDNIRGDNEQQKQET